jgi:hypothetical protein
VTRVALVVLLTLFAAPLHAQQRDPEQQLRELDAVVAARRARADAIHEQQQRASEQREREEQARNAERAAHADAVHEQQRAVREAAKAAECAQSWPTRLADAKQALVAAGRAQADKVAANKLAWFDQHCRFLNPLEIAIRKLNDPNSFVCDTQKGRPAGLTSSFVLDHQGGLALGDVQELLADDRVCEPFDDAERMSLVMNDSNTDAASVGQRLAVLCYDDDRPKCVQARASIAAWRAKHE